jgi:hypothetical protein
VKMTFFADAQLGGMWVRIGCSLETDCKAYGATATFGCAAAAELAAARDDATMAAAAAAVAAALHAAAAVFALAANAVLQHKVLLTFGFGRTSTVG